MALFLFYYHFWKYVHPGCTFAPVLLFSYTLSLGCEGVVTWWIVHAYVRFDPFSDCSGSQLDSVFCIGLSEVGLFVDIDRVFMKFFFLEFISLDSYQLSRARKMAGALHRSLLQYDLCLLVSLSVKLENGSLNGWLHGGALSSNPAFVFLHWPWEVYIIIQMSILFHSSPIVKENCTSTQTSWFDPSTFSKREIK